MERGVSEQMTGSYGTPAWAQGAGEMPPARVASGRLSADFAVLGAGVTGLSIARRLAALAPEKRIIMLDRTRAGLGSSGRNSGFLMDIPHYDRSLGEEANRKLLRLGQAGIGHLRQLVQGRGFACGWTETGCLRGAATDRGMLCLDEFARGMEKLGQTFTWLDREHVENQTGSRFYRAAIHCPGPVLIQPHLLARGLAGSLPENVELYEDTEAIRLDLSGPARIHLREGEVRAEKVFVAANGHLPLLGFLKTRLVPFVTFASMTAPVADENLAAPDGHREWGLVPEERIGTTVRRMADGRILIRNSVRYHNAEPLAAGALEWARSHHRKSLAERFPSLRHQPFSHTWAGILGMSLNGALFFGRLDRCRNVYAAAGFNGVGLALGAVAGKLLVDLAFGCTSEELATIRDLPRPSLLPPPPIRGLAVRLVLQILTYRGRGEI